MYSDIRINELKKIIGSIYLIDIRDIEDIEYGMIPTSHYINGSKLINNPSNYLNKTKKYYLYCNNGEKSKEVCKILSKKGFNLVNIEGGYRRWILENE